MMRKISKLMMLLSFIVIMSAACSTGNDKDMSSDGNTSIEDSIDSQQSFYEESENTAINSSNQNKDTSTLMEDVESEIESGADELFDNSKDNSSDDETSYDINNEENSLE